MYVASFKQSLSSPPCPATVAAVAPPSTTTGVAFASRNHLCRSEPTSPPTTLFSVLPFPLVSPSALLHLDASICPSSFRLISLSLANLSIDQSVFFLSCLIRPSHTGRKKNHAFSFLLNFD